MLDILIHIVLPFLAGLVIGGVITNYKTVKQFVAIVYDRTVDWIYNVYYDLTEINTKGIVKKLIGLITIKVEGGFKKVKLSLNKVGLSFKEMKHIGKRSYSYLKGLRGRY